MGSGDMLSVCGGKTYQGFNIKLKDTKSGLESLLAAMWRLGDLSRKYQYTLALLLHPSSYFPCWPLTQSSGCRDLQCDPLKPSLLFLPRKPLYLHLVGFSHIRRQEEKGFLAGSDQWGMTETART